MVGFTGRRKRPDAALVEQFEEWWTSLERQIDEIRTLPLDAVVPDIESLFRRKTYNEPLPECTAQSWLDRYSGARETKETLSRHFERVRSTCGEYVRDVYAELMSQVDGYAMDLRALLLKEERFDLGDQGRLCITPPGIEAACEERRRDIKRILSQLLDPRQFPNFPDAFKFDRAETVEEKKHLIHRAAAQLQLNRIGQGSAVADREKWADSSWDFDRIMSYVASGRRPDSRPVRELEEVESLIRRASRELGRAKSGSGEGRLMPLDYALQALCAVFSRHPDPAPVRPAAQSLVKDVKDYLDTDGRLEGGGSVKESIRELQAAIGETDPTTNVSKKARK